MEGRDPHLVRKSGKHLRGKKWIQGRGEGYRKGFGYGIRPSNASAKELLGRGEFAGAVFAFLRDTKVGIIKEGVLNKD